MRSSRRHLLALAFVVAGTPLHAQDSPRPVEIHGFGSWAYGRTTHNRFLAGSPAGEYQQAFVGVNLFKRLDDRLTLHAQAEAEEGADEAKVILEYAFADYKLNDYLTLRVGQVKHPFGIYTEVFHVGTLRPFGALDSLDKPVTRDGLARVIGRHKAALRHRDRRIA